MNKGYIGIDGKNNGSHTTAHAIVGGLYGAPLCKRKNTHVIAIDNEEATPENITCKKCKKLLLLR